MAFMSAGALRENLRSDPDIALLIIAELMSRLRRRSQSVKQLALWLTSTSGWPHCYRR